MAMDDKINICVFMRESFIFDGNSFAIFSEMKLRDWLTLRYRVKTP
jgi:hypothetical protein